MKILCVAMVLMAGTAAFADDPYLPVVDGDMSITPKAEDTVRALTSATFEHDLVKKQMAETVSEPAEEAYRDMRRQGLDFRVSVPEGVGVAFSYSPAPPLTTAIAVNTLVGGTVSVSAEATFNTMWWYDPLWKHGFTPVITVKFSNIRFTGLADSVADNEIKRIYGDHVTVKMAGRYMNMASAMGGFDWISKGGLHLMLKGGITTQVGTSGGGDNRAGDIKFKGWWGPAAELGIGGTFKWF